MKEFTSIYSVPDYVDLSESHRSAQSATIQLMKDQLSVINKKMDDMMETLKLHSASLMDIELKLESYADSYKENQHNSKIPCGRDRRALESKFKQFQLC